MPANGEHLTAENYADQAISNSVNQSSILRLDLDKELEPDEQDSLFVNSTLRKPKTIKELLTKTYVDSLHDKKNNLVVI